MKLSAVVSPVAIISLTDPGRALAERLLALMPDAEHLYRPQPFQAVARERFQAEFAKAMAAMVARGVSKS